MSKSECTAKSFSDSRTEAGIRAETAVSVRNVSMNYGRVRALDDVCMEVEKGEMFGLIGPDGAGKTTLFRIMTTLLLADSGNVTVAGRDVVKDYRTIREIIGYMPGRFSLYQDLTVEENLSFFASVFNVTIRENYHLVEDIYRQIEPFKNRRAGKLSGGMKQKLALCCAMIHKPEILFLDEPTTGVDPVSRKEFWEMLKRLKSEGITIIVSTPYMDEAALCDRIALMHDGHFLKTDTPAGIAGGFVPALFSVKTADKIAAMNSIASIDGVRRCYPFGESLHIAAEPGMTADILTERLSGAGEQYVIEPAQPTIEDCFIDLA